MLEKSAVIAGVRQAVVRVPDESGQLVMLDDRIKEMKSDPRYSALFPQPVIALPFSPKAKPSLPSIPRMRWAPIPQAINPSG